MEGRRYTRRTPKRRDTETVTTKSWQEGVRRCLRSLLLWNDASTGEPRTRAGMQVYRVEDGKLAETWLTLLKLGSAWPDPVGQERWTSERV